eukprot:Gb_07844 [translate_table: standard]
MRQQILRKRKQVGDSRDQDGRKEKGVLQKRERTSPLLTNEEDSDEQVAKQEKLTLKKKGLGSEGKAELAAKADIDAQLLGPAEQLRQMHKQKKRRRQGREVETLARLEKFKHSLGQSKTSAVSSPENNDDEEDDEAGWLSHKLKFKPDASTKDDMARKDDPDAYVVHDPLLEKGKEKFNKMQAKLKRREREWAGKSIT